MKTTNLILSGLAIVGIGSLVYGRESTIVERVREWFSSKAPGIPSVPSPSAVFNEVVSLTPQQRAIHEFGLAAIVPALKAEGQSGDSYEVQMVAAVAHAETSYGRGWKGAMAASNNWGAVQCPLNDQQGAGCIAHGDSFSTGKKYDVSFRSYPTPMEGARDTVKHVLKHRKKVAEALDSDGATVYRAALALRRKSYYGGFCPKATSKYGAAAIVQKENLNPTSEAGKACEREAVEIAAKVYNKTVQAVASIRSEKALPLGTFEDALDWYDGTTSVAGHNDEEPDCGFILSIFDCATSAREKRQW